MANTAKFFKEQAKIEVTASGKVKLRLPDVIYAPGTGVEWNFLGPTTLAGVYSQFAGLMDEFARRCEQERKAKLPRQQARRGAQRSATTAPASGSR
jgi:hypothetical protein